MVQRRRRGRHGDAGGGGRRRRHLVGEHGQELVVVEAIEAGTLVGERGPEEGDGVVGGAAAVATPGGGEVEELVRPGGGRGGAPRANGRGQLVRGQRGGMVMVMGKVRPVVGHGNGNAEAAVPLLLPELCIYKWISQEAKIEVSRLDTQKCLPKVREMCSCSIMAWSERFTEEST